MGQKDFNEALGVVLATDPRYHRDAYHFVREALDHTQEAIRSRGESGPRHVNGRELLEGLRELALKQFGPMAHTVLSEWGIGRCEDFGEIVFNLVDHEILSKTERDSRDDFKGGYDFTEAFRRPFLPKQKVEN